MKRFPTGGPTPTKKKGKGLFLAVKKALTPTPTPYAPLGYLPVDLNAPPATQIYNVRQNKQTATHERFRNAIGAKMLNTMPVVDSAYNASEAWLQPYNKTNPPNYPKGGNIPPGKGKGLFKSVKQAFTPTPDPYAPPGYLPVDLNAPPATQLYNVRENQQTAIHEKFRRAIGAKTLNAPAVVDSAYNASKNWLSPYDNKLPPNYPYGGNIPPGGRRKLRRNQVEAIRREPPVNPFGPVNPVIPTTGAYPYSTMPPQGYVPPSQFSIEDEIRRVEAMKQTPTYPDGGRFARLQKFADMFNPQGFMNRSKKKDESEPVNRAEEWNKMARKKVIGFPKGGPFPKYSPVASDATRNVVNRGYPTSSYDPGRRMQMNELQQTLEQPSEFSQRPTPPPVYSKINPNAHHSSQFDTYINNIVTANNARSNPAYQAQADSVTAANEAWRKEDINPYSKTYKSRVTGYPMGGRFKKKVGYANGGPFDYDPNAGYGLGSQALDSPFEDPRSTLSRRELWDQSLQGPPVYAPGVNDPTFQPLPAPPRPYSGLPQYSVTPPQEASAPKAKSSKPYTSNYVAEYPKPPQGNRTAPTFNMLDIPNKNTHLFPQGQQPPEYHEYLTPKPRKGSTEEEYIKRKLPFADNYIVQYPKPPQKGYAGVPDFNMFNIPGTHSNRFPQAPPLKKAPPVVPVVPKTEIKAAEDKAAAKKKAVEKATTPAEKAAAEAAAAKAAEDAASKKAVSKRAIYPAVGDVGKNPAPTKAQIINPIPKGLRKGEKIFVPKAKSLAAKQRGMGIGDYKGDIAAVLGTIANQIQIGKLETEFSPETVDLPRNPYTDRRQALINQSGEQYATATKGVSDSSQQGNQALKANLYAKSLSGLNQQLDQEQQREDVINLRHNEQLNRTKAFNAQIRNYGKEVSMGNRNEKRALTQANIDNLVRSYQGNEAVRNFTQTEHGKNFLTAMQSGDTGTFERMLAQMPKKMRHNLGFEAEGGVFKKGGIYIKPKNRGKFNALKKRTGKTTEQLKHSKNPLTRKRATFAANAKKWKH